jgi:iron complex outermembrane receptor protein
MYRGLLVVCLSLMVCSPVVASEVDGQATVMGEVVVTATRQAEEISKVPANVTVITEEEIDQSAAQNIPELLRTVPGVLVNDISGNGRNYTVDLRGFGETASLNTLVLVDGRRINQADLSGVDWILIPKDRVQRIEIVRGSRGSVLYGDNATAGVINIITKKGSKAPTATGTLLAGSYDTFQGSASVGGDSGTLSLAADGNYRTSDGYRDNSDTEAKDFGLNLTYDVSERLLLNLSGGYHDDDSSLPGALKKSELDSGISRTDSLKPDDYADTEDWYVQGGLQLFINDDSYFEASVASRNRNWDSFSFFGTGEYDASTEIDTLSFSPQLVLNENLFGFATNVLLGFDYEKSEEDILNELSLPDYFYFTKDSYELSRENYGYFAHADIAVTDKLTVSGGARNSRAEFDFKHKNTGTSESTTLDEDLYTVGVNYLLMENSSVYASYTKSSRFPVLDEFFSFTDNAVNSELTAQTTDDFEVGLRLHLESGAVLGVNLFRLVTENELFYNPAGGDLGYGANENLDGDTIRQGVELSANQEIFDILFSGSYTYRDTEINGGQYDGKEVPDVPRHQATFGAQKTFGSRMQLDLNGTYVGSRRFVSDFANKQSALEDYLYVTSKLSYLLDKGTIYVAVNNLLDEEYSEYGVLSMSGEKAFYPSPEINYIIGAEFRF